MDSTQCEMISKTRASSKRGESSNEGSNGGSLIVLAMQMLFPSDDV